LDVGVYAKFSEQRFRLPQKERCTLPARDHLFASGDFDRRSGKLPAQRAKREDGSHVTCDAMRNGPPSRKVLYLHRESHSTPALSMRAAGPPRPGPTMANAVPIGKWAM